MENSMDRVDQTFEDDQAHLAASDAGSSLTPPQSQIGTQKRRDLLRTRKGVIFLVLAILLITASLGASFLAFHILTKSGPSKQWSYQLGDHGFTSFSPIVANGMVYILSQGLGNNYTLFALDEHSGNKRWSYQLEGFISLPPIAANGVIYVVPDGSDFETGTVYALDAVSGHEKWSYQTVEGSGGGEATVANGMLYLLSRNGTLSAFDAFSGHKEWTEQLGDYGITFPVVANGFVYVAIGNSTAKYYTLYALDALSGHEKWSDREANLTFQPIVANGTIYVVSDDVTAETGTVYALDAFSGHRTWSEQIGSTLALTVPHELVVISSIVEVVNNVVYVDVIFNDDTHNATLYALDSLSGHQLWTKQTIRYGLTIANGMLYVFSGNDDLDVMNAPSNSLSALDARSGREVWSHKISAVTDMAEIETLEPIVVNHVVYVGATDNMLHALDARSGREIWTDQVSFWSSGSPSPTVANGLIYVVSFSNVSAIQPRGKTS